jgi:hypothetical protein
MNDSTVQPNGARSQAPSANAQPYWQSAYDFVGPTGFRIGWAEPSSIVGLEQFGEEYPIDAFPSIIKNAIVEVQSSTQAPMALVAASALAVVSSCVQGLASVQRDEGLVGPIALFLMTLAPSGERKTASDKKFREPILEWERAIAEAMVPQVKDYLAAKSTWEAAEAGIKDAIRAAHKKAAPTTELAELEQRMRDHMLHQPCPVVVPRLLRGDDTQEALAVALQAYPVASVISSEAGILFGSISMNAESATRNFAQINLMWDGGPIKRDRTTQKNVDVDNVAVTMGLQVQPAVMQNFIAKLGALAYGIGYFARFLLSQPESTQGHRFFKAAPKGEPELERFCQRAIALLSIPVCFSDGAGLMTTVLTFSPEANSEWIAFYNRVEEQLARGCEYFDVQDVAAKIAEQAARIAANFHMYDPPTQDFALISVDHMRKAIELAHWYLDESLRCFKMNVVPETVKQADQLERWLATKLIETKKEYFSMNFLQKQALPKSIRLKAILDAALELLQAHGRVKLCNGHGKALHVYVNPLVLKEYE